MIFSDRWKSGEEKSAPILSDVHLVSCIPPLKGDPSRKKWDSLICAFGDKSFVYPEGREVKDVTSISFSGEWDETRWSSKRIFAQTKRNKTAECMISKAPDKKRNVVLCRSDLNLKL